MFLIYVDVNRGVQIKYFIGHPVSVNKKIVTSSSKVKYLWNICYTLNILILYFGNNVFKKTKYVNDKLILLLVLNILECKIVITKNN